MEANRWVCEAIFALRQKGLPCDVVTVAGWLRAHERMAHVGGSVYLAKLIDQVPFVASVAAYARTVAMLASLRAFIKGCQRAAAEGYVQAGDAEAFIVRAQGGLDAIAQDALGQRERERHGLYSERDMFGAVAKGMIEERPLQRCTTGIRDLDEDIGGHMSGMVSWMGAATNWGKSSFAVMTYDEIVRTGKRVLLVSSEDKRDLYGRRILARRANVSAYRLRERTLDDADFSRLLGVAESASVVPFFIEAIGMPAERIAARIKHVCASEAIDLVMVDYLQAISARKATQDKRTEMTLVARTLTDAIKQTAAAGLIFSQIKRLEPGRVPTMNDLKESGDIENMADNVIVGYTRDDHQGVIRVAKAKDAIKYDYLMSWNAVSCSFTGGARIEGHTQAQAQTQQRRPVPDRAVADGARYGND